MNETLDHLQENDLNAIETEEGIIGGYRKMRSLSIVIPTYNRKKALLETLERLMPIWKDVEFVIVDDCSEEDIIFPSIPNIKLIRNPKNLGTVKSLNIGIENASNNHILILADDNHLLNPMETIRILKETDEKIVATRLFMEKKRSFFTEIKFQAYKIPAELLAGEPYNYNGSRRKYVKWCNNAFFFDRRTGLRFEENDYIRNYFRTESEFEIQARNKGIKILYEPSIVIIDRWEKTGGLRVRDKRTFVKMCVYNHVVFLRRNYRLSKYYKIPFYFFIKSVAHPRMAGEILKTISLSYYKG